jgi:hypothetical protein
VIRKIVGQGQPREKVGSPISTNDLDMVAHICYLSYKGGINRWIMIQAGSGKMQDPA